MTSPQTNTELNVAVSEAVRRGDRAEARKIANQYWMRVYQNVPVDHAEIFRAMCAQWVVNKEMK